MTRLPLRDDDNTDDVQPRRRRSDDENFLGVKWNLVFQVIGWFIAGFLTYNAITERIAIVETQQRGMVETQQRLTDDVREMRNDIKTLLQRR